MPRWCRAGPTPCACRYQGTSRASQARYAHRQRPQRPTFVLVHPATLAPGSEQSECDVTQADRHPHAQRLPSTQREGPVAAALVLVELVQLGQWIEAGKKCAEGHTTTSPTP